MRTVWAFVCPPEQVQGGALCVKELQGRETLLGDRNRKAPKERRRPRTKDAQENERKESTNTTHSPKEFGFVALSAKWQVRRKQKLQEDYTVYRVLAQQPIRGKTTGETTRRSRWKPLLDCEDS